MLKRIWNNFEEIFVGIMMIGMTTMVTLQIIFRYIIKSPLSWSEEAARYMMVYAMFFGAAIAVKRGKHMAVDFLVSNVSTDKQKIVTYLSDTIFIVFCLIMIKQGIFVVERFYHFGQVSAGLKVPMYIVFAAPLISFILIIIHIGNRFYKNIKEE